MVAGSAAGIAVHEAIVAKPDVHGGLAKAAELLALAGTLGHLALRAAVFGSSGSGGHNGNVTPPAIRRK
jgi:hypothetical protein